MSALNHSFAFLRGLFLGTPDTKALTTSINGSSLLSISRSQERNDHMACAVLVKCEVSFALRRLLWTEAAVAFLVGRNKTPFLWHRRWFSLMLQMGNSTHAQLHPRHVEKTLGAPPTDPRTIISGPIGRLDNGILAGVSTSNVGLSRTGNAL